MLIQGLVDASYRFLDVCRMAGGVFDARVFAHSALYSEIEHNRILPNRIFTISGTHIPL